MTADRAAIDLDHNAGTPVDPRVLARFIEVERACPSNPGSPHAGGRRARAALEDARAEAAGALGVAPDDVVFVASGTEANNLVVLGAGRLELPVQLAEVEHKSVLEPALRRGVRRWAVDPHGRVLVGPATAPIGLVCLVHAQGEVGTVQPVADAAAVARAAGAPLHVDAAQTLGRIPLRPVLDVADTISLSVHKVGGLRGASVLITRRGIPTPVMRGGGQERGLRPGTPSPSLAAATALAIRLAVDETGARAAAMRVARDAFVAALEAAVEAVRVTPRDALPNTVMFEFPGVDGRMLLPALDLVAVRASQGSACASGSPEAPAVLLAMGLDSLRARRCVRFASAAHTSRDEAIDAAGRVASVVERLRRVSSN